MQRLVHYSDSRIKYLESKDLYNTKMKQLYKNEDIIREWGLDLKNNKLFARPIVYYPTKMIFAGNIFFPAITTVVSGVSYHFLANLVIED